MVERHGFRTLKIKGGQGVERDLAGIREIVRAVGDGVRFYVDANGAYPMHDALDYVRAIADAGAFMLEDPCPLAPDSHFRKLQENSPISILVDFGCGCLRDAGLFLEQDARALSVKPGRFGLTHARAMADLAHRHGSDVVVGLMGESALGTLAGLQFAAASASPALPAELTWFLAMDDQVVREVPKIVDGMMEMRGSAGLASQIAWEDLEKRS
jgi:L-alanine-DL-glutamate epimerase-like enolase superfamily enzyme